MTASGSAETPAAKGESALGEEDRARADLYAVLARLYYGAPDRALLASLARHENLVGGGDAPLGTAWRALSRRARDAAPEPLTLEYDALFVGTGKAEITLYCSYYLAQTGRERIVVALRDELRELGLGRTGASHEPEDHLAALCEVMRHLVSRGSASYALECQKGFFLRYIANAYIPLTDAMLASAAAGFYQDVAQVTRAFFEIESRSFEMV